MLELSCKVTEPPLQIGPLLVAPVDVGTVFTVIVVVYTVDGLQPLPLALSVSE